MQAITELVTSRLDYFILLFLRVSGLIFSSPIFGRKNIPNTVKIGYCGSIALLFFMDIAPKDPLVYNSLYTFVFLCIAELLFGLVMGYTLNLFFTLTFTAGQLIDMQMGFGMANVFDVQSSASVPMMGNFLNIVLLMVFFAVDGHHKLLTIYYVSVTQIPIGHVVFNPQIGMIALELFSMAFTLAVSVALPIIASGLLGEMVMGIIIRTVPQLNMFVIGMPVKVLLGFLVMLVALPVFVGFSTTIFSKMFEGVEAMFAGLRIQ